MKEAKKEREGDCGAASPEEPSYTSDVTRLTAVSSEARLHTLACLLECCLGSMDQEIYECAENGF